MSVSPGRITVPGPATAPDWAAGADLQRFNDFSWRELDTAATLCDNQRWLIRFFSSRSLRIRTWQSPRNAPCAAAAMFICQQAKVARTKDRWRTDEGHGTGTITAEALEGERTWLATVGRLSRSSNSWWSSPSSAC